MKEIVGDTGLVAACGLYCGTCKRYLKEKCAGCRENEKATWCKIRTCCIENDYQSCADCKIVENLADCKKLNNIMGKIASFIFRSNRPASLAIIKSDGYDEYVRLMVENKTMSVKM